jgi:hypothetical protein
MNRSLLNYIIGRTRRNISEIRVWFLLEARMYHGEKPIPPTLTREGVEHCYRLWGWMLTRWREYLRTLEKIQQEPENGVIEHLKQYKTVLESERDQETIKDRQDFVEQRIREIERTLE